jgi:hypothetical protein
MDPTTFSDKETRYDDMTATVSAWIQDLAEGVEAAAASTEFRAYLDVMATFHTYSPGNQRLIALQCPTATHVAGFNTWKNEFNRYVKKGENAIWIWGPIIAPKCPSCSQSRSYHTRSDCTESSSPDSWNKGLVGFRPVSVFDISQTTGDDVPALEYDATGDADGLLDALVDVAADLGVPSITITGADEWVNGRAAGFIRTDSAEIEVQERDDAAMVGTIAHEFAHAILHLDADEESTIEEIEAEAVAYVFGRHFGLDVSGSELYLASWTGDDPSAIEARLDRISTTAKKLISAVEDALPDATTTPRKLATA